ncbi:hypothetical protein M8J76_012645 [Diaphorina citri]|nr:hypothetical protein M8J76_012645 [Diaphorina citri]KAI5748488.1 hypothetical protein M8J77_026108 [Diaphorina citri]
MDLLAEAEKYTVDSNEVVEFKMVKRVSDLEDDSCSFKPEMSHQIFGQQETIFGYLDLKIKLYFTPGRLFDYVNIEYTDKIDPDQFNGVKPDDIMEALKKLYTFDMNTSLDKFVTSLDKEPHFKPSGELFHSFKHTTVCTTGNPSERTYELYSVDQVDPDMVSYLSRVQPFLLWYIDCACFVDTDDERWSYFFLYEKYQNDSQETCYGLAGYATVYKYYTTPFSLPPKWRPRISQVFVLPPYQRSGLGPRLYDAICRRYVQDKDVVSITVEDPSEECQSMRDYVDVSNCAKLTGWSKEQLVAGYTPAMEKQVYEELKLCKKQARRVYEILRLGATNMNNSSEYKQYRLLVKNRLNAPHQKDVNYQKRLNKVLKPEEMKTFSCLDTEQQRKDKLHSEYKELEKAYLKVIERVKNYPFEN